MIGQGNHFANGVNQSTKNNFLGFPACIALPHLFERGWFLPSRIVVGFQGAEHLVKGVEERPFDLKTALGAALDQAKEVINIDIPVLEWLPEVWLS